MKVNSSNKQLLCSLSSDNYEVEFDMKSRDTIHDLRQKFEEEEGSPPPESRRAKENQSETTSLGL